jgi:hypothetical protein
MMDGVIGGGETVAGIGCLDDGAVALEGAEWRGSWLPSFW